MSRRNGTVPACRPGNEVQTRREGLPRGEDNFLTIECGCSFGTEGRSPKMGSGPFRVNQQFEHRPNSRGPDPIFGPEFSEKRFAVKRRNRKSRQRGVPRLRMPLDLLIDTKQRRQKSWTFEHLEDRLVFSLNLPVVQTISFSSDNATGAALTALDELNWSQTLANYAAATGATAGGASLTDSSTTSSATAQMSPNYVFLSLPNDPLFPSEWHILNTGQEVGVPSVQPLYGVAGQDLNVAPAWNMVDSEGNTINGKGITVAVIDSGVQIAHPDLAANISPTLRFNASNGTSIVNPSLFAPEGGHGTSVAGIIAAVGNNGIGVTGIAPAQRSFRFASMIRLRVRLPTTRL